LSRPCSCWPWLLAARKGVFRLYSGGGQCGWAKITIHQVNNELAKTGGTQVTKQLLDGLVARQLLVNAAKKDKLDTDPAVLADMERSRNLVLAQSYVLEQVRRRLARLNRKSRTSTGKTRTGSLSVDSMSLLS
jgi:hypothetical protein